MPFPPLLPCVPLNVFLVIFKSPNHHENVFSLSIHAEPLENLINVFFLTVFSDSRNPEFKKLAYNSMSRRLKNTQEMIASN